MTLADSGVTAQHEIDTAVFDLMVLDLSMPGVSGFDVLEHVRTTRKLTDMPILVITGHDDSGSVMRAFELGATSFLAKPLNWVLFVQHVQFVLNAARTQAELRHATRTAEFMSDLKSRLVGTIVTEFQAPLRSAFGFARLLKEETDGPIELQLYRAWIVDLHRALERLNGTHLKMLNFGRSLAENIVINEETLNLDAMLAPFLQTARETATRRQITLLVRSTLSPRLQLRGDGVLLNQALRGVLENACKFTPRGGEIRLELSENGEGDIVISVHDGAPPLSPSQIDEVLGHKSYAASRPETVDLSTGLKMSRVLFEAHNAHMNLKSVGVGMQTDIVLPRGRVLRGDANPTIRSGQAGAPPPTGLTPTRLPAAPMATPIRRMAR